MSDQTDCILYIPFIPSVIPNEAGYIRAMHP